MESIELLAEYGVPAKRFDPAAEHPAGVETRGVP